jgi:hypothetical protein
MEERHELAGMICQAFTADEIKVWIDNVMAPNMKAWRPMGVTLHNTGRVPGWPEKISNEAAIQQLKNMSVTWASPPNNWKSGPHFVVGKNGIIIVATPPWIRGTHSPSFNFTHWGIEMVGDYDLEPFPDAQRIAELPVGCEVQRTHAAATGRGHFAVRHVGPTAVVRREARATVGEGMPHEVGARHQLAADRHHA